MPKKCKEIFLEFLMTFSSPIKFIEMCLENFDAFHILEIFDVF